MCTARLEEHDERLTPGHKYKVPDPSDGTRIFYESLLRQKPNSLMA